MPTRLPILLVLLLTVAARAQTPVSLSVEFGWAGHVVPGAWNPVRVRTDAGERVVSGEVVLSYMQTTTQRASLLVPVVTTPGHGGLAEFPAFFPSNVGDVAATLTLDGRMRPAVSMTYEPVPLTGSPIGRVLSSAESLIVVVGSHTLAAHAGAWRSAYTPPEQPNHAHIPSEAAMIEHALAHLRVVAIEPAALPRDWIAYRGVTLLVIDASRVGAIDDRAREAIRGWISSGGRVLVHADVSSPVWRTLLPEPAPPLAEPLRVTPGADLHDLLEGTDQAPAESLQARLLSPQRELGWTGRWPAEDGFLFAIGPSGFGVVGVMGVDPRRVPAAVSNNAAAELWRDALLELCRDLLIARAGLQPDWERFGTSAGDIERRALIAAYDSASIQGRVGLGTFILLALATLALVLLVGPVDMLLIRRRGHGEFWWIACGAWLALAGAIAYAVPLVVRSSESRSESASCEDYLPSGPGWSSGALLAFHGTSETAALLDDRPAPWWSLGETTLYSWPGSVRSTIQSTPFRTSPTIAPLRLGGRIWTVRPLAHESSLPPGPSARVVRRLDLTEIEVRGLPQGTHVASGIVNLSGETHAIAIEPAGDGILRARLSTDTLSPLWREASDNEWYRTDNTLHQLTRLQGSWQRARSIDLRVRSGSWALVSLEVNGGVGPSITGAVAVHRRVLRILAPIVTEPGSSAIREDAP